MRAPWAGCRVNGCQGNCSYVYLQWRVNVGIFGVFHHPVYGGLQATVVRQNERLF